jgi:hypothetical protein
MELLVQNFRFCVTFFGRNCVKNTGGKCNADGMRKVGCAGNVALVLMALQSAVVTAHIGRPPGQEGCIIFTEISEKLFEYELDSAGSGQGTEAVCCLQGNEPSVCKRS